MARGRSDREEFGLGKERSGSSDGKKPDEMTNPAATKKPSNDQVGRALRSVYDDTLRETVPTEFEDLLKKLK